MKKLLLMLFCVLMTMALVGCGNTKKSEQPKTNKVLQVVTDSNYPPFEYFDKKRGIKTGFDLELMEAIGKKMGYDKVEFIDAPFGEVMSNVKRNKFPLAIAAITVTEERKANYAFSDIYAKDGMKIVVKKDSKIGDQLSALEGKTVAALKDTATAHMVQKYGKAKEVKLFDNTEDTFKAVQAGKLDALVTDKLVADFYLTNGYGKDLKAGGPAVLNETGMAIAASKGNQKMIDEVNKALKEVKRSGEYKKIYESYFGNIK